MPRHYLGLCAIAKDETPFLREWAAYYHRIGFERIFIYDNGSAVPVRDTVADMYDAGMLDTYTIQGDNMQLVAYNHCLQTHGAECEWMAFFDLDEFLLLRREEDARAFLAGYEDYAGLSINSNYFSSSGHLRRPEGLVMENYRECLGLRHVVKCIVRPAQVEMPISPEHFLFKEGGYAVNADKIPVYGAYVPLSTDHALLNHYVFRSQQDYEEKVRRGHPIWIMPDVLTMNNFYRQAEQRVETQTEIIRHAPHVAAIMRTGAPAPRHALDSSQVLAEPFGLALARLAAVVESGDYDLARLVFLLGRSRFADKSAYLALGSRACRAAGDSENAKKAALALLALSPALSSYLELLLACEVGGETTQAEALASFLRTFAEKEGAEDILAVLREKGFSTEKE
ncbi:glycosyltransferase family 2 protein [Desulfovibrio sp. OttesenSCG-928-O18]|nr:glycosyltransferase family 2 protein [Desulfovibrio sp. OttesenSCG-928-O18]